MALFTRFASEIWRKYVTDGVAASGLHQPDIDEIRVWGTEIEAALGGSGSRVVTASGAVTVADADREIIIDRTVPEAGNIALGAVASKLGSVTIYNGDAANAQTFVPSGTDTFIGGVTSLTLPPGGRVTLEPYVRAAADWWLVG